eukprot:6157729-Alexandrium_andersonii.AAC.1
MTVKLREIVPIPAGAAPAPLGLAAPTRVASSDPNTDPAMVHPCHRDGTAYIVLDMNHRERIPLPVEPYLTFFMKDGRTFAAQHGAVDNASEDMD